MRKRRRSQEVGALEAKWFGEDGPNPWRNRPHDRRKTGGACKMIHGIRRSRKKVVMKRRKMILGRPGAGVGAGRNWSWRNASGRERRSWKS